MKKELTKSQVSEKIEKFFLDITNKKSSEIQKIKKLAMSYKIPIKKYRKFFCKECLTPFSGEEKIRIRNKIKSIFCIKCDKINRWKLN